MDVLNLLFDFLVKLDGGQIFAIILAVTISSIFVCIVLAKFLSGPFTCICNVVESLFLFLTELNAICTYCILKILGLKPPRFHIKKDEFLMDDGETDLPPLSARKNPSDGDDLLPDNDELESDITVMNLPSTVEALKKYLKQHDNKKEK